MGIGSGEVGDVLAEVNFFGEFLAVGGIIPGLDGDDFIELRGIGRRFGIGLEIVGDLATKLREGVFDFLGRAGGVVVGDLIEESKLLVDFGIGGDIAVGEFVGGLLRGLSRRLDGGLPLFGAE